LGFYQADLDPQDTSNTPLVAPEPPVSLVSTQPTAATIESTASEFASKKRKQDPEEDNSEPKKRRKPLEDEDSMREARSDKPFKKSETNGSSHTYTNGFSNIKALPNKWLGHDREEVTRILIQSLHELGYNESAAHLSSESGFKMEEEQVTEFRKTILEGKWSEAERLLFGHQRPDSLATPNGSKSTKKSPGFRLTDNADSREMAFWIRQQKYLELLEKRDLEAALEVLRKELTPLHQNADTLHILGGFLMCHSADDLKRQANWDGAQGLSRKVLLSSLSSTSFAILLTA
jgi:hypothetical protein